MLLLLLMLLWLIQDHIFGGKYLGVSLIFKTDDVDVSARKVRKGRIKIKVGLFSRKKNLLLNKFLISFI